MRFSIIGDIREVETIAIGSSIRDVRRLRKAYGLGRSRKRKGIAQVRSDNGELAIDEIHWYEADGIGRKEFTLEIIEPTYEQPLEIARDADSITRAY